MTGEKAITYMVVRSNGDIVMESGVLSVQEAQRIVGGDIEWMQVPSGLDLAAIANRGGVDAGLNPNWKATAVLRITLPVGAFVTGDVIFSGGPDMAQDLTSLSVQVEEALRRTMAK